MMDVSTYMDFCNRSLINEKVTLFSLTCASAILSVAGIAFLFFLFVCLSVCLSVCLCFLPAQTKKLLARSLCKSLGRPVSDIPLHLLQWTLKVFKLWWHLTLIFVTSRIVFVCFDKKIAYNSKTTGYILLQFYVVLYTSFAIGIIVGTFDLVSLFLTLRPILVFQLSPTPLLWHNVDLPRSKHCEDTYSLLIWFCFKC